VFNMLKRIFIGLVVLAVATAFSINYFSRKAPDLLRGSIERALNKQVVIGSIEYHFPGTFELQGFEIKEKGRFEGETSFLVDRVLLKVSPLSLSRKMLVIDGIQVENASIIIRKYDDKLIHSLSDALKKAPPALSGPRERSESVQSGTLPLEIRLFVIQKSNFKFMDYDVETDGFVVALDDIDARLKNIRFPFTSGKTSYKIKARLPQGRDQRAAGIAVSGWTEFLTLDTDANFSAQAVFLPYFRPYYSQVTPAAIEDGYADAGVNVRLENNDLVINADLELFGLLFRSYESEDQLFGLKAEEILSFLKDRSGKLKFQFVAKWNIADRSVKARDVIRSSIEKSLKKTIIGNIGNILENTLKKVNEQGIDKSKDEVTGVVKKIKDFLKY